MAWGDLRYDHSDIFCEMRPEPRREPECDPTVILEPASPTWEGKIRALLFDGVPRSERQIWAAYGLPGRNGQLYKTLRRMTAEGKLVREFRSLGRHSAWYYRRPDPDR